MASAKKNTKAKRSAGDTKSDKKAMSLNEWAELITTSVGTNTGLIKKTNERVDSLKEELKVLSNYIVEIDRQCLQLKIDTVKPRNNFKTMLKHFFFGKPVVK
jgi:predicted DNA-binding protein YlxM (UPF0122 family)